MKRVTWNALIALLAFAAGPAQAQVVQNPLLVGNQSGFNALDLYNGDTGAYVGPFAGGGTGSFSYFRYGGPNTNLFVVRSDNILQFNGMTGNFINVFSTTQLGGRFSFGPDNNLYRTEPASIAQPFPLQIGKYSGTTGARLATFVASATSGLSEGSSTMTFGPDGDLYVAMAGSIFRYDGLTGAPMGPFIPTGSGGLGAIVEVLFTSGGKLLAVGGGANTNDKIFQFDATTGAYLGVFAMGNGLDGPIGLAEGPDGRIFASSGDSIKRFDQGTGAFLNDFVTTTAHLSPTYMAFAPFPIPEPSSLLFCALGVLAAAQRLRRRPTVTTTE